MSSRVDRSLALPFLGRTGLALILLFVINTLFALFPFRVLDPAWQLRVGEVLRTTGPFPLLGVALLYLCKRTDPNAPLAFLSIRRIRRLAPLAAAGFLLLIPLQLNASWTQIRSADLEAAKTLRTVERRIQEVKDAGSAEALQALAQGLPPQWMPVRGSDLESNRRRLLATIEPEMARLQTARSESKKQAIEQALQIGLRDTLLSLVFATTFQSLAGSARSRSRDAEEQEERDWEMAELEGMDDLERLKRLVEMEGINEMDRLALIEEIEDLERMQRMEQGRPADDQDDP